MIAGPATTFYDLRPDNGCVFAGLRLRPGAAAAVVGRPVSAFTDRQVAVDSVLGLRGDRMAEKVLAATTPSQRVAALQNALVGYLADAEPSVDTAVTQVIGILRRHPGRPVSSLAAAVGVSERQLRRRFEAAVGYGPKRFGRILRFQPHMINECVALAGMSPVALPRGAPGPTGDVSVSSNTTPGGSH
jgi:hypothetical protein